ncbi:hypothetical protein LTR78_003000 [Recurvomyces mirabilis]|uniref:Uncharacterized protein n=1 Tax=Recurvomyces mirabilis TaxID=574656 RepID=A0AAE0WTE8_9PEZI|nr:hypothetical protein LTR78_003000 [Recurvomyces mirabilis]KAK5159269.1 hypothetical protein LTS14_002411 [Recurvomyces mirabilis]
MAQQCSLCDSWWPEACICAQLASVAVLGYQNREAGPEAVQQARETLSRGLPPGSRACLYHKSMLNDLVNSTKTDRTKKTKGKPSGPVAMAIFDDSVLEKTALLPMCTTCGISCGVLTVTAEGLQIVIEMDGCTCALAILGVQCAFCKVQRISAATELAVEQRKHVAADGEVGMKCACGQIVDGQELARKCAGCEGIKTGPFHHVVFEPSTEAGNQDSPPRVVAAALSERPSTPPDRYASPAEQPAPKKRKRAAPRAQTATKQSRLIGEVFQSSSGDGDGAAGSLVGDGTAAMLDVSPSGYRPFAKIAGDFWSTPEFSTGLDPDNALTAAASVVDTADDDVLRKRLKEFMGL